MFAALFEFTLDQRRNERKGINLPVRVRECDADNLAFIFKDQHIINEIPRAEFFESVDPNLNDAEDLLRRTVGERQAMVRRVNDNLADSLCRLHAIETPFGRMG